MHSVIVKHRITGHEYPWPSTLAAADPDLEVVTGSPQPSARPTRKPRKPRTRTPRVSGVTATPAAENTEAEKEAAES